MSANQESLRAPLFLRLLGALWMLLVLGVMLTFWQGPFLFTLASAFRFHLLAGALLLGLPLTIFYPHHKRWVAIVLPLAVSLTFLPYFRGRDSGLDPERGGAGQLKVAVANLYSGNHDLSRFTTWLAQESPDVVAVLEVSEPQRAQLESLPFAYKSLHPRRSNFGLGLLCKRPPLELQLLEEETPFPSLLASWPEYRILVTHPIPPIDAQARQIGDAQIERLVAGLDDGSSPLMVLGDLNATGWDRRVEPLKAAGLVEARLGHGILPTWPVGRPYMAIPIDHIYGPASWESRACRSGPDIGSDHYPLLAELLYPSGP